MLEFDPSLELQAAIRSRLLASPGLLTLVPADNIGDQSGRPEKVPSIIIGEAQVVYRRFAAEVHTTIHVWQQEPGLVWAKAATGHIVRALQQDAQMDGPFSTEHFAVLDMRASDSRFMRDPHGSYSHTVINVTATVKELAA